REVERAVARCGGLPGGLRGATRDGDGERRDAGAARRSAARPDRLHATVLLAALEDAQLGPRLDVRHHRLKHERATIPLRRTSLDIRSRCPARASALQARWPTPRPRRRSAAPRPGSVPRLPPAAAPARA